MSSSSLLPRLLTARGITDIETFLHPPFPEMPSLLSDITKVVGITNKFISEGKRILIYGDYDADGITSTAILWQVLSTLGAQVVPFIPNREGDGYGFRYASLQKLEQQKNQKFDLIITLDNGIAAFEDISKAVSQGYQFIVVDHHLPSHDTSKLKEICLGMVHSTETSAAGLSYFLASGFSSFPDLGLAALGVVADCLPLIGVNRSIVYHGLRSLRVTPNPGIKQLIVDSGLKVENLKTYDLSYVLAPRINAAGRLGDATDALRLLCCNNQKSIKELSESLQSTNRNRHDLQEEQIKSALKELELSPPQKFIFISGTQYAPGLIGLISGKLTQSYNLPSFVLSENGTYAKGSCRSLKNLHILDTLSKLRELFVDLGGHDMAAGFTIEKKNVPILKQELSKLFSDYTPLPYEYEYDLEIKLSDINLNNAKDLEKLEPFGVGNPTPLFKIVKAQIRSKKLLGSTLDHLKLKLDDPSTKFPENVIADAIAFKLGRLDASLSVGDIIGLITELQVNTWNGISTPQLVVKQIISE